ncbi:MAG: FCD domain-containing protein [bacterium]|nr:FCD domain-containing protein [bacterium]
MNNKYIRQFIPEIEVDMLSYISLDRKFHEELINLAQNDVLKDLYLRIRDQIQLIRAFMLKMHPERRFRVNIEHLNIIEALLNNSRGKALDLLKHHIECKS